jgi:hypothetical protein
MKARFASLVLALTLVGAFFVAPGHVIAQETPFVDIPIEGDIVGGGTFEGLLDITRSLN